MCQQDSKAAMLHLHEPLEIQKCVPKKHTKKNKQTDAEDIALNFTGNHHQENLVKRLFQ